MTLLSQLQNIVGFAYNNPHSDWYREICVAHGIERSPQIETLDDFRRLPALNRSLISQYLPFQRLSDEIGNVHDIRSTSGTSGQAPLFYLRTTRYRHMARRLVQDGARRKIYVWGYQHVITHVENDRLEGLQTVICDPQQLAQHVPLVSALKADTLAGTPSLLILFGRMVEKIEDRLHIRFLELTGEPCRPQTLSALKQLFPLAKPYNHYAMGEMGQETGIRTPMCTHQNSGYFHLNPEGIYAENLDGELVLTHLDAPTAFPLIRYKTGDSVEWLGRDTCTCGHDGISFELSGRANVDFIRIAGVEIRYEEIAAIVADLSELFAPYVAVEAYDTISIGAQRVSLEVKVVRAQQAHESDVELTEKLQHELIERLQLSATTRLSDMIKAGLFNRPNITLLSEAPVSTKAPGIHLKAER